MRDVGTCIFSKISTVMGGKLKIVKSNQIFFQSKHVVFF